MRSLSHLSLWVLAPWLPLLACSSKGDISFGPIDADETQQPDTARGAQPGTQLAALGRPIFPGGGTSGAAQPLSPALAPETSSQCDPTPSSDAAPGASVQTVCFFGEDEPDVPAAAIEQIVEVVGTAEWVHIRLTLNPSFVDNTYGSTAIGWGADGAGDTAGAPPPPPDAPPPGAPLPPDPPPPPEPAAGAPDAGIAPPPPEAPDGGARPAPPPGDAPEPPRGGRGEDPAAELPGDDPAARGPRGPGREAPGPRPGKGGHSFQDLLGSDHAELSLLDADGAVAMRFRIDYLSQASAAASGFGSLGIAGGEGRLIAGDAAHVLASTTSLDRNLNACGLGSFTEDSPETDASYTPHADASDWDYRVSYEMWIATAAFGSAGFGSALIDNVHASPSKGPGDTVDVLPAPCPADPDQPEIEAAPLPPVLQPIR